MKILKLIGKTLLVVLAILILIFIIALLFLRFCPSVGKTPDEEKRKEYAERTEYFDGKNFRNVSEYSLMTSSSEKKNNQTKPDGTIPVIKSESIPDGEEGKLNVTWFGHSSSLVQLGTKNILIDPVFSKYASPVSFAGVKRFSEVPVEVENLPEIDVLLISHDHYDHLDYQTIMDIDSKVANYIVPLGVEACLTGWGIDENKIHVVSWWDEVEIENISFTSTPAQHFSGRNPLKANTTWWTGYYFKDSHHSVYYSGDSGYNAGFKEIGEKFGGVDLALMECGQYDEAWAMSHMNPKETVQAVTDVKAKWFIPVHWGAFVLAKHEWCESVKLTTEYSSELSEINEATPKIGECVDYDEINRYTQKWWEQVNNFEK